MTEQTLRELCHEANLAIQKAGLVLLTWGNASVLDRARGLMAIKPSGVDYAQLCPANIVLVELESGRALGDGSLRPSSDTPTHLVLYRAFAGIGGIVHTHSAQATAWAQAGRDLPCFGTTHADNFHGAIPCTRPLTAEEINGVEGYEHQTGRIIVSEFEQRALDPLRVPGVLVHGHAPFAWGEDASHAVQNAIVLEAVAGIGLNTVRLNPAATAISSVLLDKHFLRKHGPGAYYGQPSARREGERPREP